MSGHSKWHQIKRSKGALDKKRGAIFTRLAKNIQIAAKNGGDPTMNPSLALAIDKAKAANMTKDSIQKAVAKGSGASGAEADFHEILYEGYAPCGVALMIKALTDNTNRTVSHVRHTFSKFGGTMGASGSVGYLFSQMGIIDIEIEEGEDVEEMEMGLIDAGAENVVVLSENELQVHTKPNNLAKVQKDIENIHGVKVTNAELGYIPITTIGLSDEDMQKVADFIAIMEDNDDIDQIYSTIS